MITETIFKHNQVTNNLLNNIDKLLELLKKK